jgi:DNA-binding NtrC family response regulator
MSRVLVVEDDPHVAPALCGMLEHYGHACSFVCNGADAFAALDKGGIDVVVADVRLPGGITGHAIAERAEAAGLGRVLITGHGDAMTELEQSQHCIWLQKPFRGAQLAEAVAAAVQAARN